MSGFAKALSVFGAPNAQAERQVMQLLLPDLLDGDGKVRFKSIVAFHNHLCRRYQFGLVQNETFGVRPGGRHLFYVLGNILLRVKTTGTDRRPDPHLTISVASGLGWPDEVAKLSRSGDLIPKQGAVARAGHRALRRLGDSFEAIEAMDDRWAEACHFDFVRGFDASGATALPVVV